MGAYYGAMLAKAGEDVHFLFRSDYQHVVEHGLQIHSRTGSFTLRPHAYSSPKDLGPSDLIIIALKTTANHAYRELLTPLVHQGTMILTIQNGLGNEEALAGIFPPAQVLGGLCFVCLNRTSPGVIQHIEHGLIKLGEHNRPSTPRARDIAERFKKAGVPCQVTDDVALAHWEKLVWNVPFNGLGVAGAAGYDSVISGKLDPQQPLSRCLPTDVLLQNPGWSALVRELMLEVITIAKALGKNLPYEVADAQIARTGSMGAYWASTLIDFERGQPLELESLFLEPLRRAREAGVAAPRLQALCDVLATLDQMRNPDA